MFYRLCAHPGRTAFRGEWLSARRAERPPAGRGGEGRDRTGDTTVFSRVLYLLSYLALYSQYFLRLQLS